MLRRRKGMNLKQVYYVYVLYYNNNYNNMYLCLSEIPDVMI